MSLLQPARVVSDASGRGQGISEVVDREAGTICGRKLKNREFKRI